MDSTKVRIKPMLETKKELSEDDMEKFGKKDPEAYPFRTHVMYMYMLVRTPIITCVYYHTLILYISAI